MIKGKLHQLKRTAFQQCPIATKYTRTQNKNSKRNQTKTQLYSKHKIRNTTAQTNNKQKKQKKQY